MATYSTGISASWGGSSFAEIYDISLPLYGGERKDRNVSGATAGWTDEVGTVSISCYSNTNLNVSEYGQRKSLVISGGGMSLTSNAVCTGVSATPQLNGVTRYTFTAKLLDY